MKREVCSVVLQRWEVIESLHGAPKDKRTLVDDLECSRSTVNRAIRELESMGVVEYVEGEYAITPLGDAIATGFADVMDTVNLRLQLGPFLQWMPDGEFDLALEHLHGAELLVPEPGNPYAMINRHIARLEQAETIQCVLPLTGLHAHQTVHTQVVENGAQVETVVTPEVAHTLQSDPDYVDLTVEMAATGRFEIYEFDGDIPYFVGVLDETVQIGVDEGGEPRAILETDTAEVRDWAETKCKEFEQRAHPVEIRAETAKVRS